MCSGPRNVAEQLLAIWDKSSDGNSNIDGILFKIVFFNFFQSVKSPKKNGFYKYCFFY